MPPAIPVIAAAAGALVTSALAPTVLGGFFAAVVGAVAASAVSSVGGSLLGQEESGETQTYANEFADGGRGLLLNKASGTAVIPVVYGQREMGGTIVFLETDGTNNEDLYMVLAVCEGEIAAFYSVFFDGYEIAVGDLDVDGSVINGRYAGVARIVKYLGSDTQTADPMLMGISSGSWTSDHRLQGVAYLAIKFTFSRDIYSKIPVVTVMTRGKLVYDPVTATTGWSQNPVWCIRDYLVNTRYGRGIDSSLIDDGVGGTFRTEATTCDTNVVVAGESRAQYTCNGAVDPSQSDLDVVSKLLTSCRGMLVFSGGLYKLVIDKAVTPSSFEFNEDNIVGAWNISLGSKSSQFNRIRANFFNPARSGQADIVIFDNPTYRTADNGVLLEREIYLPFTSNRDMALYLIEQNLRQSRQMIQCEFTATIAGTRVEVGDVVPITHSTPGWVSKNFRILGVKLKNNDEVVVSCREYDASVYATNTITAGDATPNTNLPNPFDVRTPTSLSMIETLYMGGLRPVNRVIPTWLPSADQFVTHYEVEYKLSASQVDGVLLLETGDRLLLETGDGLLFDGDWIAHADLPDADRADGSGRVYTYIDGLAVGNYDFRVRAVNSWKKYSSFLTITDQAVTGSDTAPVAPVGLAAIAFFANIRLDWVAATEHDLTAYRVYRNTVNVFGTATEIKTLAAHPGQLGSCEDFPPSLATYYYWVTAIDAAGNESTQSASVSTARIAVATGDLGLDAVITEKVAAGEITESASDESAVTATAQQTGAGTTSTTVATAAIISYAAGLPVIIMVRAVGDSSDTEGGGTTTVELHRNGVLIKTLITQSDPAPWASDYSISVPVRDVTISAAVHTYTVVITATAVDVTPVTTINCDIVDIVALHTKR